MAHFQKHCRSCHDLLGDEFKYVHLWLDEFFALKGPAHRKIRHHKEGIEECRNKWGDRAAEAAELHITEDIFGLPIPSQTDYIGGDGCWPVGDKWNSM